MRKGWEYKKLGEVCEVVTGTTPKTNIPEYWGKGHYWVTPAELNDATIFIDKTERQITDEALSKTKLRLLPVGTVLLSSRAPIGKVAIANAEMYCNQGFKNCICSEAIYNKYLFYFLRLKKDYLNSLGRGATFKEISKSIVESIKIPLPPKSTQLAIVSELDKINELIRLKKEQLKDFDNLAQSLFYEMFGEGKCLRKKLKDIVKIQSGQVSPLEEPYSEMIHIGPANIESNTGRLLNLKTAKEENLISGKYLFDSSMVLYSKIRPNLNKVTIPSFEGICSADMYPIIPLESIDKNFLLFLLKQKEFLTYAISNSGRANIPKINREALLNYEAILPPLPLQHLFAQRIEQIEREKSEVQKSIQDLETLLASRMQYWFE